MIKPLHLYLLGGPVFYPTHIIIHHSLTKDSKTVSTAAIRKYHTETLGWNDCGYHYLIEKVNNSYEIFTGRMLTEPGAHCKDQGMNYRAIGICFIGNFDKRKPPKKQWEKGIELVKSLCQIFNIDYKNVRGHRVYSQYKSCPGRMFDMSQFRHDLL